MEKHLNSMAMTTPPPSPPSTSSTTFIQADTTTFRDLVQKLTGFSGNSQKLPITHLSKLCSPATPKSTFTRRSPFKLHERRNVLRKLEIKLRNNNSSSKNQIYRFESPVLSPVTPLTTESSLFFSPRMGSPLSPSVLEEDKAIADGGFYLHPSPLNTPRNSDPPELLNLFPSNSPSEQTQNA